ncbi:hypothetical protein ACFX15_006726 [Malus domestica]|uniref:AP2/ERF domain-containing protein n=1 Tax=Malus domestica TaxID=3750 RepID=A0A498IP97_MALDO|nr:hypothetical protein DVH24_013112 [Malus domestica]
MKNHTRLWLRTFDTTDEVVLAYDKAAYKLKGDFARSIACTFATTAQSSEATSAIVMVCLVTEKIVGKDGKIFIFCDMSDRVREEWLKVGIDVVWSKVGIEGG